MRPDTRREAAQGRMAELERTMERAVNAWLEVMDACPDAPNGEVTETLQAVKDLTRDVFHEALTSVEEELREAETEVARIEKRQHSLAREQLIGR